MCTVTANCSGNRLLVAMNRDERIDRALELPPTVHRGDRVWAGPLDGEKFGTWIGVNDDGVAACLLNGYHPEDLDPAFLDDFPSRGEIIPRLMALSGREVGDLLQSGLGADRYPSFTLLVWAESRSWEFEWRVNKGWKLTPIEKGWRMVSSSAWRTQEVLNWRHRHFKTWIERGRSFAGPVPSFNLLEIEGEKRWSPWMTRPLTATRSVTMLEVNWETRLADVSWWSRVGQNSIDPERADIALFFPLELRM